MTRIRKTISALEESELKDSIKEAIKDSIKYCPAEGRESYKEISFEDYSDSLVEEIWDENDNLVGEGISVNTISSKFVINDETKSQIEKYFIQARDEAWAEYEEVK